MNIMVKAVCEELLEEERMNELNEWKELKIGDLPSDILVKNRYDLQFKDCSCMEPVWANRCGGMDASVIRYMLLEDGMKYRYRKRQQKQPSHEEIGKVYSQKNIYK